MLFFSAVLCYVIASGTRYGMPCYAMLFWYALLCSVTLSVGEGWMGKDDITEHSIAEHKMALQNRHALLH